MELPGAAVRGLVQRERMAFLIVRTMKVCIWTIYPNHYQDVFFDALRTEGVDLRVCYFGRYCQNRLSMGWVQPKQLSDGEFYVSTIAQAKAVIPDFNERILVNTGYYNAIYWQLIRYAHQNNMKWVHWSEASSRRLRGFLQRKCYGTCVRRFALGAFAIGNLAKRDFRRWGIPAEKINYLPYTTPFLSNLKTGEDLKGAGKREGLTFIYCGTLCKRKATDLILLAVEKVHKKYPAVRLRLIGNQDLDRVSARRLGLLERQGYVSYIGAVAPGDIDAEWMQGDVCLLPSRFDGWGLALAEGARNGLALIGSDRCGAAEHLIVPGKSGLIVRSGDADSLAEAMMRLAANPALAREYGKEARRLVEDTAGVVNAMRFVNGIEGWVRGSGNSIGV